jgi:hypothetical protein
MGVAERQTDGGETDRPAAIGIRAEPGPGRRMEMSSPMSPGIAYHLIECLDLTSKIEYFEPRYSRLTN